MRIVVDAMGGDEAPSKIVDGAVEAAQGFVSRGEPHTILLTGPQDIVRSRLVTCGGDVLLGKAIECVHTEDVIAMDEAPAEALKKKTRSSIHVGLDLVRRGEAEAFVSMGNTGAVMACGLMGLGRIEGVQRPTIGAFFPSATGKTLVLDVGTNVECKPTHLLQFAVMGCVYMESMLGVANPSVGLMSVGEEDSKGDDLTVKSNELFRQKKLFNFKGNVEGRDVLLGGADMIICNGFVGNVILKMAESFVKVLRKKVRDYVGERGAEAGAVFKDFFGNAMVDWDYQSHGGVPLLGVNGVVIIGHGSSSSKALCRAIHVAKEMVEKRINEVIREKIKLA